VRYSVILNWHSEVIDMLGLGGARNLTIIHFHPLFLDINKCKESSESTARPRKEQRNRKSLATPRAQFLKGHV
jgi:hypothetical protein